MICIMNCEQKPALNVDKNDKLFFCFQNKNTHENTQKLMSKNFLNDEFFVAFFGEKQLFRGMKYEKSAKFILSLTAKFNSFLQIFNRF